MKNILIILPFIFIFCSCGNNSEEADNQIVLSDSTAIDTTDYSAEYESTTIMKTGTLVPDFSLAMLDGGTFQLSEYKGKTVFLNFFALSCPICMKELPELEKQIWQKYKDNENIVVLTIGREETIDKLKAFREKKHYTFPIAVDTNRAVYAMFAERYIPRNIIIDKEGKLVFSEVGYDSLKFEKLLQLLQNMSN